MNTRNTQPGTLRKESPTCPWCASVPRVAHPDTEAARWLVLCPNRQCPVQPFAAGDTEAEAVEKWSRRTK